MCETIDSAIERTVEHLFGVVFAMQTVEPKPVQLQYEFSSPEIMKGVKKECKPLEMQFVSLGDPKHPFGVQIKIDDVMRAKFFIAMRCAKRRKRYREMGKEVDFKCFGENWAPPDDLNPEKRTLQHQIYLHTYGAN